MPSILSPYRPDPKAYAVACAVEEAIKPDRVILFGSRAWGDFDSGSDIDLLIITDDERRDKREVELAVALRTAKQEYGPRAAVDLVHMSEGAFHFLRCERNRIAGQAEATHTPSRSHAVRGKPQAKRMQARMLEVAESDLIKRQNGCDCWIRRYLANHFDAAPNGAYEAVMGAHCLRRGYGTDSHRFDDGSGAIWTWDDNGKGDLLTLWAVRADMDAEIDEAIGEVTRDLRGFNGFWSWEMQRKGRLGAPRRPVEMKAGDEVLKVAEVLMDGGYWVDKFFCGWQECGADRGEKARLNYSKMLFFLVTSVIPKPPNRRGEIDIMLLLYGSKRSFAPRPAPPDCAPDVLLVHEIVAGRVALQQYAQAVLGVASTNQTQKKTEAVIFPYRYGAVAMGVGRP